MVEDALRSGGWANHQAKERPRFLPTTHAQNYAQMIIYADIHHWPTTHIFADLTEPATTLT